MRWVVTGANGMLAHDLVDVLRDLGHEVLPLARAALDVTDAAVVDEAVPGADVVANCAAWTAVDAAESAEASAFEVNALGAALVADAASRHGARLVHFSTDYVFGGDATAPYEEDAPPAPRSAYGRTKLAGEWAVRAQCPGALVLRTAWLYGAAGRCFPRTIAAALKDRGRVEVVDDQKGQPTWTRDVAELAVRLVVADAAPGIYHATASGQTTWHGFAREVAAQAGYDPAAVQAVTSASYATPAARPRFSVLGHAALQRAGLAPIEDWRDRWRVAAPAVLGGTGAYPPAT